MVRLVIAGACGRMGSRILELAGQIAGLSVSAVFERPDHLRLGREMAPGVSLISDPVEALQSGDVLVDFTHHTAAMEQFKAGR
jgi:4-hydroxy-tetrahydrodipicolinate reductase